MNNPPSYRVPTMDEIRAVPWNGYNVASLFAGAGGSSTGYRMSGYRVLYVNEFVEKARDTYAANAAPYTIIDGRDIREVSPESILEMIGKKQGELDVLDGSPPCASFSTAGRTSAGWGKVRSYSDTEQRTDDLFYEYARILDGLQPRVFIAENVSGLTRGVSKGYFKQILAALKQCGYRVKARLLDASWLDVPQARVRLIFMGVREDLNLDPVFPKPLPYRRIAREVLDQTIIHDTSGERSTGLVVGPCPTVLGPTTQTHYRVIDEGDAIDPETGERIGLNGMSLKVDVKRVLAGKSNKYINTAVVKIDEPVPTVSSTAGSVGAAGVVLPSMRKFTLAELRAVSGFPPDFQLTGRYQHRWERIGRAVPPMMMKHISAAARTVLEQADK